MTTRRVKPENPPLRAYLGKPELKIAFLAEIDKHERADQITKGSYGEMNGQWRGCAIGCSLRSLNILRGEADPNQRTGAHDRYPAELGLPLWLAHAEDHIFENLPKDLATTWPRQFAEAIPVGIDLTDMLAPIMAWTLDHEVWGLAAKVNDAQVKAIVLQMAALFHRQTEGQTVSETEWNEAAGAARAARNAWAARATWNAWAAGESWTAGAARDAWIARAARAAGTARDAWAARAARTARDTRGTAWAEWAARDAWAAGDAWAARATWAARDAYYAALSEEVLRLIRAGNGNETRQGDSAHESGQTLPSRIHKAMRFLIFR